MPGFGDDDATVHPDYTATFAEHHFRVSRVSLVKGCYFDGKGRWRDVLQIDEATLRFGNDFLGNDQHVSILKSNSLSGDGIRNRASQVVAGVDFGKAADGDDANF